METNPLTTETTPSDLNELLPHLGSGEPALIDRLAEIGAPAVEPLIPYLVSKVAEVQIDAYNALLAIGEPAVAPLIARLDDPDPRMRAAAANTLGTLGSPLVDFVLDRGDQFRATPRILALLDDPDPLVARVAAYALGSLQSKLAEPKLEAMAARPDIQANSEFQRVIQGSLRLIRNERPPLGERVRSLWEWISPTQRLNLGMLLGAIVIFAVLSRLEPALSYLGVVLMLLVFFEMVIAGRIRRARARQSAKRET
jgi:hypothetical protein